MALLSVKRCRSIVDDAQLRYATSGAAGFDLVAAISNARTLLPFERLVVPTGFCLEIPKGFEGQIRSRSGLAATRGLVVLNSPGTIDSDYRGEISVVVINFGSQPFVIEPLMRIAQMVIAPVIQVEFSYSDTLEETDRGLGGFGSTGTLAARERDSVA